MDPLGESLSDDLKKFAKDVYTEELTSILMTDDIRQHYSINIDTMSLFSRSVLFAHHLFECPEKALKLLNQAFGKAAEEICQLHNLKYVALKRNIHVRLTALPNIPEINRTSLPDCSDIGQFMCISGTIIRGTTSKMLEYRKLWKCKKCRFDFTIDAEVECGYVCEKPVVCPNPEWCNGKNFNLLSSDVDPSFCKDYQEVKIQEQVYNLTVGSVPKSMWVILEDDLVDSCQPGNDVNVSGVLIQRWKPFAKGRFMDIDLVLLAHNIEVKNKSTPGIVSVNMVQEFAQFWIDNKDNMLKARDIILSSICPQVFGLFIVKLAVGLVLAGGVEKKDANSRIRGDSHLLLVGDPGTGKSQFLKYATKVSTRSVMTSGIGTTNAGLTVSAVKDGGKWQLEAGALVLADGGICCIDEFSCIKEHDKTCIHEAMEQQTISVAKAGLVCSLSTRCAILSATNPKGKYDSALSISENTALASPLLSRFDVILVLLDISDENWDTLVSSYILEGRNLSAKTCTELWPLEKMRHYFSVIRYISPRVTPSCEKILQAYYKRQRSLESRNFARTTPRLLQSLIRLAEGHARLMFRDKVLTLDAIMAIILMESSMSGSSVLSNLPTIHTSFPENPTGYYYEIEKTVLKLLNLDISPIDCESYAEFYQESCLKELLTDLSINCKLSKTLDLFENSNFPGASKFKSFVSTSTQQCETTAMRSKDFQLGNDPKINFSINDTAINTNMNEIEMLHSTQLPKSASVSVFFENREKDELLQDKDPIVINEHRENPLTDENSTLSAIGNIFSTNLSQPNESHGEIKLKENHKKRKHLHELFKKSCSNSFNEEHMMPEDLEVDANEVMDEKKNENLSSFKHTPFKRFNFQPFKRSKFNVLDNLTNEHETNAISKGRDEKDSFSKSDVILNDSKEIRSEFIAKNSIESETDTILTSGKESSNTCLRAITEKVKENVDSAKSSCGNLKKFAFKGRPKKNQIEVQADVHQPASSDANQSIINSGISFESQDNSKVPTNFETKTDILSGFNNISEQNASNKGSFPSKSKPTNSKPANSQSTFKRILTKTTQNNELLDLNEDIDFPFIVESKSTAPVIPNTSKAIKQASNSSGSTQTAFKRIFSTSGLNMEHIDLDLEDPMF